MYMFLTFSAYKYQPQKQVRILNAHTFIYQTKITQCLLQFQTLTKCRKAHFVLPSFPGRLPQVCFDNYGEEKSFCLCFYSYKWKPISLQGLKSLLHRRTAGLSCHSRNISTFMLLQP